MTIENTISRRRLLAAMPLLLGAATGAIAQETPNAPIRMAFNGRYRPFSFRDGNGPLCGILIDIFDRIGADIGLTFDYADLPWARAQKTVKAGHLDGICTVATAERRSYIDFAPTPLFDEPTVIVYRDGDARAAAATVPDGLGGLRIGEPLGNAWVREILVHGDVEWAADIDNLLGMVAAGRIDATVLGLWTVKAHLARLGLGTRLRYQTIQDMSSDSNIRFGLRKSFPNGMQVVASVEAAIQKLRASGAIERIVAHYIA